MDTRIVGNDVYLVVELRGRGTHFQLERNVEQKYKVQLRPEEEMEKRNLAEKLSARVFSGSVQLRLFLQPS